IDHPDYLEHRLSAAAGWERSLDFYLGSLADAVLLDSAQAPLELAAAFRGGASGATLLSPVEPLPEAVWPPPPCVWPMVDDRAVARPLGQALGLAPELAQALRPAYLVDTAAAAERLAKRHPGISFLSPDGVWAQGGLLHVEGGEALPGVLERERDLAGLSRL